MPLTDDEEARFTAITKDNKLEDVFEQQETHRIRLILVCSGFILAGFILVILAVGLKAPAGGIAGFAIAMYGAYHLSKQFIIKP
jgi:hypothetical protein